MSNTNTSWRALEWEFVCDKVPSIRSLHDTYSDGSESYLYFRDFIDQETSYRGSNFVDLVQEWWNSRSKEEQKELLTVGLEHANQKLKYMKEFQENLARVLATYE